MPKTMKTATLYTCTKCDGQSQKWSGQCGECGAWGTIAAQDEAPTIAGRPRPKVAAPPIVGFSALKIADTRRLASGISELDRVLGGGLVSGSVTLLGGEPGIGKSTLSLALAAAVARAGKKTVYVSGEESGTQIKMRADRIGAGAENLFFLAETNVEAIIASLAKERPALAVIDSVQTLFAEDVESEAGGMTQVRSAAARLVGFAKESGTSVILIGHVTKDGSLAGPKTLEHVVDTVLAFEGERSHAFRVLRSLKNRFGSTDEIGVFRMAESGLEEIRNPSAYLLDERRPGISGSVISCIMEGTRPVLVEIQALVQKTSFGYPVRRASGFDSARLEMLIAVLGRRAGTDLGSHDVYVNVVGGLKIKEPASDLAVMIGLASALKNAPLAEGTAVWGEVGLGGEVRSVSSAERRLHEAAALGVRKIIAALPRTGTVKIPSGVEVLRAATVSEAVAYLR